MQLTEITFPEGRPVDGYGPGFFRVAGQVIKGAALVLPTRCTSWAGYDDFAPLLAVATELDVVFVGTGAEITPIPAQFRAALEGAGIGVETMNSPTACRTYNILLSESRRVGLALFPV